MTNNIESVKRANHRLCEAFDKQICHIYPKCSNQVGQNLKNASGHDNES